MHQGEELKKFRKKRKIKQSYIADLLGIKEASVYYVEKREVVQLDTLKKYCKALSLPITYFYPDIIENKGTYLIEEPEALLTPSNMKKVESHMGNKIRQFRKAKHVKVSDFAKALGYTNRQSVYSMEKREAIDLTTIKKAAEYLEIPIENLINSDTLNTFELQPKTPRDLELELTGKNKKIIELQEKVIELQEEIVRVNKLLSQR